MTYDLALYPASGPGLGHLMRCYALAEAAVEMGKKALVCMEQPTSFGWPCPVELFHDDHGYGSDQVAPRVSIVDGHDLDLNEAWHIIDRPEDISPHGPPAGFIYPHFGATPIPGYPTLYGEQWMPIRRHFRYMRPGPTGQPHPAVYKASEHIEVALPKILPIDRMSQVTRVIVPASTVAYEAMVAGRHVLLHDNVAGLEHIRDAMLEAGVAEMWPGKHLGPGEKQLDGLGAKRILEALL